MGACEGGLWLKPPPPRVWGPWGVAGGGQFLLVIPSPGLLCCVTLVSQFALSGPLFPLPCTNG